MYINILHYHLNPGGVTRIIESQIKSLKKNNPETGIRVICGHCPVPANIEEYGAELIIRDEFNYLTSDEAIEEKYNLITAFLKDTISKEDIIHFHNLNLGKNPLLTLAVSNLAVEGYKVVNHAHDFAEDREENYNLLKQIIKERFNKNLKSVLYPDISNYFYVVLNSSDLERLKEYGVPAHRRFLLPNPVVVNKTEHPESKEKVRQDILSQLGLNNNKKIIIYPVRVIRRKNIGEFILLSVIFNKYFHWFVTQAPKNPVEIVDYEKWKQFCTDNSIPVLFEVGTKINFEKLMLASEFCITTSIKEGFGMAYLEPWLMNVPVVGRNIKNITGDLKNSGIQFLRLYNQITVMWNNKQIDFKDLRINEQMDVILGIKNNEHVKDEFLRLNPFLETLFDTFPSEITVNNKRVLEKEYSLEKYGEKLNGIYQKIT